jgi:hypothetical protein
MDLGLLGALALLVIWAVGALVLQGPGWIHLLLTAGVSLLIYRIVVRGSSTGASDGGAGGSAPRR